MTIYLGYDIEPDGTGSFGIKSSVDPTIVIGGSFPNEDAAMDAIDACRRKERPREG